MIPEKPEGLLGDFKYEMVKEVKHDRKISILQFSNKYESEYSLTMVP